MAGLVILTQIYIGYSFYKLTQDELNQLKQEIEQRNLDINSSKKNLKLPSENVDELALNPKFNNQLLKKDPDLDQQPDEV